MGLVGWLKKGSVSSYVLPSQRKLLHPIVVLPKACSVALMQMSAPFWAHPVAQFSGGDGLLGSRIRKVSTSVRWVVPVIQQRNFLHFFQFMQGSKLRTVTDREGPWALK